MILLILELIDVSECLGPNGQSMESLTVPKFGNGNKTFETVDTSLQSEVEEVNDPALSSMQVERGTFADDSTDSSPVSPHPRAIPSNPEWSPDMSDEPSQEILTNSHLVRSPSKRASQVFKFVLDADRVDTLRPGTPSSINALSSSEKENNGRRERSSSISSVQALNIGKTKDVLVPSRVSIPSSPRGLDVANIARPRSPTPNSLNSHQLPSMTGVFLPPPGSTPGPSTGSGPAAYKPLPTPPPSLPLDARFRIANAQAKVHSRTQSRAMGPRMPGERDQRIRGGSLPLLSLGQFNNFANVDDDDEEEEEEDTMYVTPSRPPKNRSAFGVFQYQMGKQSIPPQPQPLLSTSSETQPLQIPTPNASVSSRNSGDSSRDGSFNKKSKHERQRSQTLSRLDNPYLSSINAFSSSSITSSISNSNSNSRNDLPRLPSSSSATPSFASTSDRLQVPSAVAAPGSNGGGGGSNGKDKGRDFMTSLRQRTASWLSKPSGGSKRYSERFVAIEWDQYAGSGSGSGLSS